MFTFSHHWNNPGRNIAGRTEINVLYSSRQTVSTCFYFLRHISWISNNFILWNFRCFRFSIYFLVKWSFNYVTIFSLISVIFFRVETRPLFEAFLAIMASLGFFAASFVIESYTQKNPFLMLLSDEERLHTFQKARIMVRKCISLAAHFGSICKYCFVELLVNVDWYGFYHSCNRMYWNVFCSGGVSI